MKSILVTGGAGFIGSALVRRLISTSDVLVTNVDKLTYASSLDSLGAAREHPRHRFRRADIADVDAMRAIFVESQPDAVIHLAAESHVDRSIEAAGAFVHSNVLGTYVLLDSAREYWESLEPARRDGFRFLHVSTDEVFGSLDTTGLFTEASPYRPSSPYAATKAAADHVVRAWHRTHGLPVLISNSSNNFGPWQFPEKLIPLLIMHALDGQSLPVYGSGMNVRDWIFVEDHVSALLALLGQGAVGETYLVGGGNQYQTIEIARKVCSIIDQLAPRADSRSYADLIKLVADRPGHDFRYAMDTTKIRHSTSWRPIETIASGLHRTVQWYLANRAWLERLRQDGYDGRRRGLPRHDTADEAT